MSTYTKECHLQDRIDNQEETVRESIANAISNINCCLTNISAKPDNLRLAIQEIETLAAELKGNLRTANQAETTRQAFSEALRLINA